MGRLDGKVALISGGARGQGAAETALFTREGAKVVFGDILDGEGKAVEEAIRQAGGDATYVHLDVTSEQQWQQAVALAESTYGKLNVLVNNAGISIPGAIDEYTEDDWERTIAVNLKGVTHHLGVFRPSRALVSLGMAPSVERLEGLAEADHKKDGVIIRHF